MKLADYVQKRNGTPLGANNSLKNMLIRSLGAGKFSSFWKYWNPIWSYYLGKYVFKPLKIILPNSLSLILTFVFCGFIHDIVIMIIRERFSLIFTQWFLLMSLWIVISESMKLDYSKYSWIVRASINVIIIGASFTFAYFVRI